MLKLTSDGSEYLSLTGWSHLVGLLEMCDEIDNWLKLAFLESLAIKENKPKLNTGISLDKIYDVNSDILIERVSSWISLNRLKGTLFGLKIYCL